MIELNKTYEFKIIDLGMNFEGIAKDEQGLTIFIPGALKGEIVKAKIIKINKVILTIPSYYAEYLYRKRNFRRCLICAESHNRTF